MDIGKTLKGLVRSVMVKLGINLPCEACRIVRAADSHLTKCTIAVSEVRSTYEGADYCSCGMHSVPTPGPYRTVDASLLFEDGLPVLVPRGWRVGDIGRPERGMSARERVAYLKGSASAVRELGSQRYRPKYADGEARRSVV